MAENRLNVRGDLNTENQKITNLADPTSPRDGVDKQYADLKLSLVNQVAGEATTVEPQQALVTSVGDIYWNNNNSNIIISIDSTDYLTLIRIGGGDGSGVSNLIDAVILDQDLVDAGTLTVVLRPGGLLSWFGNLYQYDKDETAILTIDSLVDPATIAGVIGPLTTSTGGTPLTAAEIKTSYESNDDTNAFTDADEVSVGDVRDNFRFSNSVADDSSAFGPNIDILREDIDGHAVFAFVGRPHLELDELAVINPTTREEFIAAGNLITDGPDIGGNSLGFITQLSPGEDGYRVAVLLTDLPVDFPAPIAGGYENTILQFTTSALNILDDELYLENQRVATREWVESQGTVSADIRADIILSGGFTLLEDTADDTTGITSGLDKYTGAIAGFVSQDYFFGTVGGDADGWFELNDAGDALVLINKF